MTDAVDAEVKDETEEPVDLIPTLIPLQPDEVCIWTVLWQILCSQYLSSMLSCILPCFASFCILFLFLLIYWCENYSAIQCFDAVGWVMGMACGMWKILLLHSPKVPFWGTWLNLDYIRKSRPVKRTFQLKLKYTLCSFILCSNLDYSIFAFSSFLLWLFFMYFAFGCYGFVTSLSVPVQSIAWKDLSPKWLICLSGMLNSTQLVASTDCRGRASSSVTLNQNSNSSSSSIIIVITHADDSQVSIAIILWVCVSVCAR